MAVNPTNGNIGQPQPPSPATAIKEIALLHTDVMVVSLAFTPNNKTLVAGGHEKLLAWDVSTGKSLLTLPLSNAIIGTVVTSADGKKVLAASWHAVSDTTRTTPFPLGILDLASGQQLVPFPHATNGISSALFSPDNASVITGDSTDTITKWDAKTGRILWQFRAGAASGRPSAPPDPTATRLALWSPKEEKLVTWSTTPGPDATAVFIDPDTGKKIKEVHRRGPIFISSGSFREWSHADTRLLEAYKLQIWSLGTDQLIGVYEGLDNVQAVLPLPDGTRAVVTGGSAFGNVSFGSMRGRNYGYVALWDLHARKEIASLYKGETLLYFAAVSPDGRLAAIATPDGVRVFELPRNN